MFDAAVNNEPINNGYDMCDSISWIKHSTSIADMIANSRAGNQRQNSLNTNVQTFDIKSLEHDFGHMLTVLWGVKGRFSKHKDCLGRVTPQVVENTPVPKLFHHVPVLDDTALDWIYFRGLVHLFGNISYLEVQRLWFFFVA